MILCKKFVWVHLPKTGGTFVREVLGSAAPKQWKLRVLYPGHRSIREVPPEYATVPAFGFIRNPWEWYVSWYGFWGTHLRRRTGCYQKPQSLWSEPDRLRAYIAKKPFAEAIELTQKHGFALREHFQRLCIRKDGSAIEFGCFSDLRNELLRLLTEHGMEPTPKLRKEILQSAPKMVSEHRPWRTYYENQRTIDAVARYEAGIIDRFGFSF